MKVRDRSESDADFLGAVRMEQTHIRTLAGVPNVRIVAPHTKLEAAERGQLIARAERAVASALTRSWRLGRPVKAAEVTS